MATNYRFLYGCIALSVAAQFSGICIPLIDPDAGVYASISKTMVQTGDFVNLYFQGTDWLDKPHFPFWVTALFFKLFGCHDWSYKLPAILFVLMGAYYTYLFAVKCYDKATALWAVFILLTSAHLVISNNDVRAEPYLTGLIIAAVYHFSRSLQPQWFGHVLAGSFFSACAVMTKGIFTLIPIGAAVAGHIAFTRQWRLLWQVRWLVSAGLIFVFILPELYCLWKQFDLHPEKTVFGKQHVSGIKFFLWDSQFGRFFNTGPIKGKGDKLFFLHTLLWAFLPWCIIMYAALAKKIKALWKRREQKEWFSFSGAAATLLVFSFSGFQLPHYTNIIFPLLAILCADFILCKLKEQNKTWPKIQNVISILLPAATAALLVLFRPPADYLFFAGVAVGAMLLGIMISFLLKRQAALCFLGSGLAMLAAVILLHFCFYPHLLTYQSGNRAAFFMNREYPGEPLGRIGLYFPSGEFYLRQPVHITDITALKAGRFTQARYLFVSEEEKKAMQENGVAFDEVRSFDEFHVSTLNLSFVRHATRQSQLKKNYLVRLAL
ncbi:MAG: glycosyltransferase family 39 protein [Chitinophagaceae bacterium]|nr:glycosyltransferase family 39 protein [Chitinophagaceae bacterium]